MVMSSPSPKPLTPHLQIRAVAEDSLSDRGGGCCPDLGPAPFIWPFPKAV